MKISTRKSFESLSRAIRPSRWTRKPTLTLAGSSESLTDTVELGIIPIDGINAAVFPPSFTSDYPSTSGARQTSPRSPELQIDKLTTNLIQSFNTATCPPSFSFDNSNISADALQTQPCSLEPQVDELTAIPIPSLNATAWSPSISFANSSISNSQQPLSYPPTPQLTELTVNPTQSLPPPVTSCATCRRDTGRRDKHSRCKYLTRILVLIIIATTVSMVNSLLNRGLSTIQGFDAGAPTPALNAGLADSDMTSLPASVLDAADVSNLATMVDLELPDQVDSRDA